MVLPIALIGLEPCFQSQTIYLHTQRRTHTHTQTHKAHIAPINIYCLCQHGASIQRQQLPAWQRRFCIHHSNDTEGSFKQNPYAGTDRILMCQMTTAIPVCLMSARADRSVIVEGEGEGEVPVHFSRWIGMEMMCRDNRGRHIEIREF